MNPANLMNFPALLAEGGGSFLSSPIPMVIIMFVLFYFVLIRPQRQQQKKLENLRNSVGNGDKVVTIGGMHGIVTGTTDKSISVKIADGLSVKFDRSAIATVIDSKTKKEDDSTRELDTSSK